jgi:2'-5' RNA ligase
MKTMYAIWYLFEKNDEIHLIDIIEKLSQKYSSPNFLPHITAYGLVDIKFENLEEIINNNFNGNKVFDVEKEDICFSNKFWETLYVKIKPNLNLNLLNKKFSEKLKKYSKYKFNPHISLIYKKMESNEKQMLRNKINVKDNFTVSRIGILKFSDNINNWKIEATYHLKN